MLDFDHVCRRSKPSVVAMIYPFTGDHQQKFYWGHEEILIPCYKNMSDCMKRHPDADVLINFASLRSAYESTIETMKYSQVNQKSKKEFEDYYYLIYYRFEQLQLLPKVYPNN
jgi:ATP citrate (pro-S)-lyase